MKSFKNWLQNENLAGRGGGPDSSPEDQVARGKEIARLGAGAFPTTGDTPPVNVRTATKNYLDPRFAKGMKKYMSADKSKRN